MSSRKSEIHSSDLAAAIQGGDEKLAKTLLNRRPDLRQRSNSTVVLPINLAAAQKDPTILEAVIGDGKQISPQRMDSEGEDSPVHIAADRGNLENLKMLKENGWDVLQPNSDGCTPFQRAVESGSLDLVKFLHAEGADINQQSRKGVVTAPLYLASIRGYLHIVNYLLKQGADTHGVQDVLQAEVTMLIERIPERIDRIHSSKDQDESPMATQRKILQKSLADLYAKLESKNKQAKSFEDYAYVNGFLWQIEDLLDVILNVTNPEKTHQEIMAAFRDVTKNHMLDSKTKLVALTALCALGGLLLGAAIATGVALVATGSASLYVAGSLTTANLLTQLLNAHVVLSGILGALVGAAAVGVPCGIYFFKPRNLIDDILVSANTTNISKSQ